MFQSRFSFASPANCCACLRPQPLQHHMFRGRCLLPTVYCKAKTASRPGGISSAMLRGTAESISPALTTLFNCSLSQGVVPKDWKISKLILLLSQNLGIRPWLLLTHLPVLLGVQSKQTSYTLETTKLHPLE